MKLTPTVRSMMTSAVLVIGTGLAVAASSGGASAADAGDTAGSTDAADATQEDTADDVVVFDCLVHVEEIDLDELPDDLADGTRDGSSGPAARVEVLDGGEFVPFEELFDDGESGSCDGDPAVFEDAPFDTDGWTEAIELSPGDLEPLSAEELDAMHEADRELIDCLGGLGIDVEEFDGGFAFEFEGDEDALRTCDPDAVIVDALPTPDQIVGGDDGR